MKMIRSFSPLFLLLIISCAHSTGSTSAEDLLALERQRTAALLAEDHVALDRFTAPEFVRIENDGKVSDRETFLSEHRDKSRDWQKVHREDVRVRFASPDVAIVTGRSVTESTSSTLKEHDGSHRFTHVWVRRNGRWQVISTHYSFETP